MSLLSQRHMLGLDGYTERDLVTILSYHQAKNTFVADTSGTVYPLDTGGKRPANLETALPWLQPVYYWGTTP